MGGPVLRLELQVRNHDIVQGGHGLAEPQRVEQLAGKADLVAAKVRGQGQGGRLRRPGQRAVAAIGESELHVGLRLSGERERL